MTDKTILSRTPFYDVHLEQGAKMVPFAGYEMPLQYPGGIIKEHQYTRDHVGLFDVSHMGQVLLTGANVCAALERLVPVDLETLAINQQVYAVFTNEDGGILDDLIITRWAEDQLFLVVNAACKAQDVAHLQQNLGSHISVELLADRALLALQGPQARNVMMQMSPAAVQRTFMNGCHTEIHSIPCYVSRSGYTGEDGFEISVENIHAESLARLLLLDDRVRPIGLGARDSLRLEAGLCLYGHDMDAHTTPVEAGLSWSVSKSRRIGGDKQAGFIGADKVLAQIEQGAQRKRVGLAVAGRAPVREGAVLENATGEQVGQVTSGGFAPSLDVPIAMAMINSEYAALDTALFARVRNKLVAVTVAKMPFVPQRYFRGED